MSFTPNLLPDIDAYIDQTCNLASPTTKGLEELVLRLHASTDLDPKICEELIRLLFQEIRTIILQKQRVKIAWLGTLSILSKNPKVNRHGIFVRFFASPSLRKAINE